MELIVVTKKTQKRSQCSKQTKIIDLFGKIDFDPNYDYEAQRNFDGSRRTHPHEGGEPESIKNNESPPARG